MKSTNFKKAVSFFALASAFTMAGCQKDDVLEDSALAPVAPATSSNSIDGKYIVVLKDGSARETKARLLDRLGINRQDMSQVFDGASEGFAGNLSKEQVQKLKLESAVAYVEQKQAIMLGKPAKAGKNTTTPTSPTTNTTTISTTT